MKVLHLCTDFFPSIGGIEKFVLGLARYSRSRGLQPSVLCFNRIHGSSQRLAEHDQVDGIPIRRIPFLDFTYYKPPRLPIAHLARADILHIHGIGAPLDLAVAAKPLHHRPIVLSTHGGIFHTDTLAHAKQLYLHTVHRLVQRSIDCTVAASRSDQAFFQSFASKLALIEDGVDISPFRVADDRPTDPNLFVFVGRLAPNKQLDLLLRFFANLHAWMPSARLQIVGGDWDGHLPSYRALANQLSLRDCVNFTGQLNDVDLLTTLAAASFFVSASRHEGFGIATVEAMAARCVPLLNDIPAFRDLVTDNQNGLILDFSNPHAAAQRVAALASGPRAALAARSRTRAEDFAWERKIDQWISLYESVAVA